MLFITSAEGPEHPLWWLLIVLGILFCSWLIYGGPERESSRGGFLINPPDPLSDGRVYSEPSSFISLDKMATENPSDSFSFVTITQSEDPKREIDPDKETFAIHFSGGRVGGTNITGWKLQNSKGETVTIGRGVEVLRQGEVNKEEDILITRGENVTFISGHSPNGYSFKLNKCSGYLAQLQEYLPPIPGNCPLPSDNLAPATLKSLGSACASYLSSIPSCTAPLGGYDKDLGSQNSSCRNYVARNISYNSCVNNYSADTNFKRGAWRVYLNLDKEFWGLEDKIMLLDKDDKLVAGMKY